MSVIQETSLRKQLVESLLSEIHGLEERASKVAGGSAFFYKDKEIAHFHHDTEIDLRLTKNVIKREGLKHPSDSVVHANRASTSQWIELRFSNLDEVREVVRLFKIACALLALFFACLVIAPYAVAADKQPAAIFKPAIAKLRGSKTPVYLPTWVPNWNIKSYADAYLVQNAEYKDGYVAAIGVGTAPFCNADTLLYISAGKGPVYRWKWARKVNLGQGRFGYFAEPGNFNTLDFAIGKYAYHIACYKPKSVLVKMANSMVPVKTD